MQDNTPTNTKQLREEIRDRIKNILEEYIYAEYNSEIHAEPMARWPEEMINEILTLLQAQEQRVRRDMAQELLDMDTDDEVHLYCDRLIYPESYSALSEGNDKGGV